jgi:1-acyl-sn-glycerol-3-phosphate acyltransferase
VDREEDAKVRPMVRGATEKLARGESIVVFPEGTRSPTAEMLPFKKGAFLIAHHSGRPVVPVAIIGTRSILPPTRQIWLGPPGTVRVVIGTPIASRDKRIAELAQEVRERIIANCSGVAAPGSINKE